MRDVKLSADELATLGIRDVKLAHDELATLNTLLEKFHNCQIEGLISLNALNPNTLSSSDDWYNQGQFEDQYLVGQIMCHIDHISKEVD